MCKFKRICLKNMYQKSPQSYGDDTDSCLIDLLSRLIITALVVYALFKIF